MDCIDHGVTKSWTQLSNFHLMVKEFREGDEDSSSLFRGNEGLGAEHLPATPPTLHFGYEKCSLKEVMLHLPFKVEKYFNKRKLGNPRGRNMVGQVGGERP